MPKQKKILTPKQERFCEEYVVDLNGTQAAIRAGYSEKTAQEQASQNLSKLIIQNRVSELKKEISDRNKITVDECVSILADLARFDLNKIYNDDGSIKPISEIPERERKAIEAFETDETKLDGMKIGDVRKLKMTSRRAAVIELMKYLGGYEKDNKQKTPYLEDLKVQIIPPDAEGDDSI